MGEKLGIEFEWLEHETGNEIDRAFAASIGITVGDEYLTRIDDLGAKTVRNQMRGCAWHLATWFAANWWRLRWEPEAQRWWQDADWRIAHGMASAGGGYVWPNAVFASDGDSMEIAMSPKCKGPSYEPIRYLNQVQARISAAEFEQSVDQFMDSVLSRLGSLRVSDRRLPDLWTEILAERRDEKTTARRKLEAMAGYDPDDASDALLAQLLDDPDHLGKTALEEVTAAARHETGDVLEPIRQLSGRQARPSEGGFRVTMPPLDTIRRDETDGGQPWQWASKLAEAAREKWGLGTGPVSNQKLAKLLGADQHMLTDETIVPTAMPVAMRVGTNGIYDIYFNKPRLTTRRFAVSRLVGDYLHFANEERLRPATASKTSRQKFQRAFAQAFLCPFDALLDKMQTDQPDDEDIAEAAAHFEVSPLMVRTTLVNHGKLDRETLNRAD